MIELYTEYNTIPQHVRFIAQDGKRIPKALKWSGANAVPAIGATVRTSVGAATVLRYFSEHGWLGLLVRPTNPPEWYVNQNGRMGTCCVYGAEQESI